MVKNVSRLNWRYQGRGYRSVRSWIKNGKEVQRGK